MENRIRLTILYFFILIFLVTKLFWVLKQYGEIMKWLVSSEEESLDMLLAKAWLMDM